LLLLIYVLSVYLKIGLIFCLLFFLKLNHLFVLFLPFSPLPFSFVS
jgi:hypothetical protein